MSLLQSLRSLDDNVVSDEGGDTEVKYLGLALAGANALVLTLALVPEPFNAPIGLLLSVAFAAPYANLRLGQLFD
jgi:hypothetical protein